MESEVVIVDGGDITEAPWLIRLGLHKLNPS